MRDLTESARALRDLLSQRILVLDGAMGTMLQQRNLTADDFGGAALEGPRYLWWNFVSSRKERIEQAKEEWKSGRFALIPGDDKEFIPLPE